MTNQRTFPRPPSLETLHLSEQPVLDELELVAWHETDAATWSRRVLKNEQAKVLKPMLGDDPKLPEGLLAAGTDSLVIGLTRNGLMWGGEEWVENDEMWGATTELSADDVAFVARAFNEGCESVLFRPYFPLAWIPEESMTAAAPKPKSDLPPGARLVAIVDDLDKSAVLELIALAKGPTLYRRHDGKWYEDDDWLIPLRSIDPPSVVVLKDDVAEDVTKQVDEATKGMEFEPKVVKSKKLRSSAFQEVDDVLGEIEEKVILAYAVPTPQGVKGTEKLKRYWTIGEGGLVKIRWGTPGSWTRCQRHLVKYIGPKAKGYCTNLCQRMGGFGVACHVGVKGDAAMVAVGTYTPGMFKLKPKKTGRTPYARKERKTTRELTDAEIEQRREAARKSAEARRKGDSESRVEQWKSATLEQKVQMASELERAAIRRREELESLIRATDDPLRRAELQGELDDLRDMLSAKDEWLRNQRYDELKLADKHIDDVEGKMDVLREGYRRKTDSLRDQKDSLDVQIEAARGASRQGSEENAAANQRARDQVGDMRDEAARLRERAANTSSEVMRITLNDQARRYSEAADEREGEIKKFEDANASSIDRLVAKRRGISNQISAVNTEKTRRIADMHTNLRALREKRTTLSKRYSDASEYLRRSRSTGAPGKFFI